jgi:Right handed beta helix region
MRRLVILTVIALAMAVGAPVAASADIGQHGAITIRSNSDFTAPGSATGCNCVTAGNGTPASPYVIGPWAITAPSGGSSGYAIKVDNSGGGITSSFTISGISANYSDFTSTDPVIVLVDVNNPSGTTISNISANGDGRGVELDTSSYINLDQLSFNKMNGTGLYINGSSYVTVSNSKFKSTAEGDSPPDSDGLYAYNSANLKIGGVPACPKSQVCNSFDYDSGFGIHLKNTHDVTIDHASANADDTAGFVLDGAYTYNVSLGNSGAGSDGPICFTLNKVRTHTGYSSDLQGNLLLVNGSHDNAIHDDQFAAPTAGYSIASGGNGSFFDPCTKSNVPVSPVEAPMGSNNTFTNVCYSSTDIASLEPAQPCK